MDWPAQDHGSEDTRIIGAEADEVVMTDSTSVNLFKLASAALAAAGGRKRIVSDEFNPYSTPYLNIALIDPQALGVVAGCQPGLRSRTRALGGWDHYRYG